MKIYGYARVGTEEQESNGISLDAQVRTIREFCARENLPLAAVIREGGSGKDVRGRPRLRRLLALAEAGRVVGIVMTHSSRMFRDFYEAVIIRTWAGRGDRPAVIAARLNHQGYSTRSQGRWHHYQVSRILGRPINGFRHETAEGQRDGGYISLY